MAIVKPGDPGSVLSTATVDETLFIPPATGIADVAIPDAAAVSVGPDCDWLSATGTATAAAMQSRIAMTTTVRRGRHGASSLKAKTVSLAEAGLYA